MQKQKMPTRHYAEYSPTLLNIRYHVDITRTTSRAGIMNVDNYTKSISTWFKTNRLSLNVSKPNCMIFGRPDKPEHHRVYIDNIVIERVNCNTFLGVLIELNYHGLIMYRTFVTKCRRICRWCIEWNGYLIRLLFTWFTVHWCYHISAIVAKYGEILTILEYTLYISYKSGLYVYAIILNTDHTLNLLSLI